MADLVYKDLLFNMEKFIPWEKLNELRGTECLKDEYIMTLQTVAQFCEKNVIAAAEDIDHEGCSLETGEDGKKFVKIPKVMEENLEKMKSLGLFCGITIPEDCGGFGFAMSAFFAVGELLSMADASIGLSPMLQEGVAQVLVEYGNENIIEKYLPRLISGERIGAMGLTEPNAGSDLSIMTTNAVPVDKDSDKYTDRVKELEELGEVYLINGTKIFITNGFGDVLTLAKVGDGISMFLVFAEDKDVTRVEHKLGITGSPTCEIYFEDSPGVLVGKLGEGLVPNMLKLMYIARMGTATQGLGIAQAAHSMAKTYATEERVQFGVPIIQHAPVRQIIYENEIDLQATRALIYYAAYNFDMKEALKAKMARMDKESIEYKGLVKKLREYTKYTELLVCLSKYDGAELSNSITYSSLQVYGGNGFTKDYPLERFYRDARITSIYEGTTQIQVEQLFNESFYAEKVALINQFKMGNQTSFVETATNKLFFDKFLDDLKQEIMTKASGKQDITSRIQVVDRMRSFYKEAREFLFIQEKKNGKEKGRLYNGMYQRDYVDILNGIVKSYLLLLQACISDHKIEVAKSYIGRMRVRSEYLKNKIICNIDDLVSETYDSVME